MLINLFLLRISCWFHRYEEGEEYLMSLRTANQLLLPSQAVSFAATIYCGGDLDWTRTQMKTLRSSPTLRFSHPYFCCQPMSPNIT